MTKRTLPVVALPAKTGASADLSPSAMDRWNPDLQANSDTDDAERSISILDPIGAGFFYEGVTAKRIAAALRQMGPGPVVVNINSPGGDFFEGLAIYNLLREHDGEVTVKIMGLAASAASAIAMAGDTVQIARAGFFMIHNTQVCACGDRHGLTEVGKWLEPFDAALSDIYAVRTGMSAKDISAKLDRETWIGGAAAVEQGFADDLLPSDYVQTSQVDEGASNALTAQAKIDALLARLNIPRSERRSMIAAVKGGTPSAAAAGTPSAAGSDTQDAVITAGVRALLEKLSTT